MVALAAVLGALLLAEVGGGGCWSRGAALQSTAARTLGRGAAARRVPMRLRGGLDIYPFSEDSISISGSDSGRYWEENFELPPALKGVRLPGPMEISDIRNISEVLGTYEQRVNGQKVCARVRSRARVRAHE